jgi:hypothetical protein
MKIVIMNYRIHTFIVQRRFSSIHRFIAQGQYSPDRQVTEIPEKSQGT